MQIRCTGFDDWICAVLRIFMFWDFSFLANMRGTIRKVGKFYSSGSQGQGENRRAIEPANLLKAWHVRCSSASVEKGATEIVMSDGLNSAGDSNFDKRRMSRLAAPVLLFFILFAGCGIPVSRTTIIPKDVAQTPEQLIAKLDLLKNGMEIGEVFELLDVKRTTPGVREFVTAEEKQRILYGATQLVGSTEDLEQFRGYLAKHRIIEIKFRDIENRLIFDSLVSVLATKAGPDFLSYLIFYEGKLTNGPRKPDNFYQDESTRTYISDLFGTIFRVGATRGVGSLGN
jgi:hypothetical protein